MSDIHFLSFIVLSAKYFIHCAYWNGNLPNIQTYMSKLHKYEHIERLIALEKDKLDIHDKKWKKIFGNAKNSVLNFDRLLNMSYKVKYL